MTENEVSDGTALDIFTDGKPHDFYGVDNHCFRLDSTALEAVEDPDDGYRSYLKTVRATDPSSLIFFHSPLAQVTVEWAGGNYAGYSLVDAGGHIWLRVGTEDTHDYYPYFVFNYTPKIGG